MKLLKIPIKAHQIWKNKRNSTQIFINRKKGMRWQVKMLTDKTDVYAGTHTMSEITIWKKFDLL